MGHCGWMRILYPVAAHYCHAVSLDLTKRLLLEYLFNACGEAEQEPLESQTETQVNLACMDSSRLIPMSGVFFVEDKHSA